MVLASFYFKASFGARQPRSLALVRPRYVIALVLTEVPAILGLMVSILSGWPYYWALFAMSAAGYLLNFPARADFEEFEDR